MSVNSGLTADGDAATGIVLAGGSSSRLGWDKTFIQIDGVYLIERVVRRLQPAVDNVLLVTDRADAFAFLGLRTVKDIYPQIGTLGGLHAGLTAMETQYGVVVGCDMPFLNTQLLRYLVSLCPGRDLVMPRLGQYYEPLHAVYSKSCLPSIERTIQAGQRRIKQALEGLRVRYVDQAQIARYDPELLSFFNVNERQDLVRMRELLRSGSR
jgi:molybdopterin-guanine dinucleotide biosynthesis protein A